MSAQETKIKAAIAFASDEPFTTAELCLSAPAANELLVKIVATGVCHTDIACKSNGLCEFPIVLGHEGVGFVAALGNQVTGFEVGDHVILSYDYCGHCPQCRIHKPAYCNDHGSLNFAGTRPGGRKTHRSPDSDSNDVFGSFFQQSSFATYALSHESNTIKVDKALPLQLLAPLGCGVQTGAGTVLNTLKADPGSSLAIFGCGCVGLSAVMAAKVARVKNIIAVDLNPRRLDMSAKLGATHQLAPADFAGPAALVDHIREITGIGGCHYAIDTTGVPGVLRQAFDCCGPLGVTAMIAPGLPGTEISIEMFGLLPGKSIRGVVQGDSVSKVFIPKLIELWQQGLFPFDEIITEYSSIDQLDAAVNAMNSGEVIKPVVIIDEQFG